MCLLHIYLVPHVCLSTHMYLPLPSSGTTCMSAKILHNLVNYHIQLVPHGFMLNTCTSFSWYHMHMCHKRAPTSDATCKPATHIWYDMYVCYYTCLFPSTSDPTFTSASTYNYYYTSTTTMAGITNMSATTLACYHIVITVMPATTY